MAAKTARVKWAGDMTFIGESPSGHAVVMDAGVESGGLNHGIRPMEMLLLGAGGCSSIDVMMILQKARQKVTDCWVELEAERAEDHPKYFTKIHMHFVITGVGVDAKHVERAISLSKEKYCSASVQLGALAKITTDFEIREAE
ncbi:OsmC family protein [Kordiimonas gwangyangensis]|uniref:OsmC family protein n=1 Tax=Kordiimonas gwangyangensis TaxID=288022 RepID=UPI00037DD48A|nr:OsmC family protein [Kordiimonas gwangyangensis]